MSIRLMYLARSSLVLAVLAAGCNSSRSPDVPDAGMTDGGDAGDDDVIETWFQMGPVPFQVTLRSFWGTSMSDVWLSGQAAPLFSGSRAPVDVMHWDGVAFRDHDLGTAFAHGLFAIDDAHLWAAGSAGSIARWDAGAGRFQPLSIDAQMPALIGDYEDLWGTGPDALWAVGRQVGVPSSQARLIHWDGAHWSAVDAPDLATSTALRAIWGTSATELWAVGDGVFHTTDGAHWDKLALDVPAQTALEDVCGTSSEDVWVVGEQSTVRHKRGSVWSTVDIGAPPMTHLWSCLAAGDQVWITGDLIGGSLGGRGAVFHWDGGRWRDQKSFLLQDGRNDTYPIVTLGVIGTEVRVMDQLGRLYFSRRSRR
jgi:hypothetical protein